MGYDRKYGKVTTERGTIGEDEPVFVIRAADVSASAAIEAYAFHARRFGASTSLTDPVFERAEQVRAWQRRNPDLVRIPTTKPGQIRDADEQEVEG